MEREYHISLNGKNLGTFTLTQLQERKIDSEAIAWYEGLDDWKPVTEIEELKDYIKSTPPPVPASERKKILHAPGYLVFGIISLVITYLLNGNGYVDSQMNTHPVATSCVLLGGRSIIAWLISDTMKLYKRQPFCWGVFGFFLPTLAMLWVAFVKPLKKRKPSSKPQWY